MAIEGLAAIKRFKAEKAAADEARNRPKAEYLSSIFPKKTGDSIDIQFAQEFDKSSPSYDPERGLGIILNEHEAPGRDGFKRRANCTNEHNDGSPCLPCERKRIDYDKDNAQNNWKTKSNVYVNVFVEFEGEVKAYVLSRNAGSTFMDNLLLELDDDENEGSISNAIYTLTKTGSGTQVSWNLRRRNKLPLLNTEGVEVYDLRETVERKIPYEEQAEYYGAVWSAAKGAAASEEKSESKAKTSSSDDEW